MARITPNEAIQRLASLQIEGMHLAPAKPGTAQPEFIVGIGANEKSRDADIYLFRQGSGSLITPAYDEIQPLLGETAEGDFEDDMPPAMADWLVDYAREIDWYHSNQLFVGEDAPVPTPSVDGGAATTTDEQRKNIAALCKAVYGQGTPYNDNLIVNGEKCVTGCWATAVAIIMQYWFSKGFHRGCTKCPTYRYSDGFCNNEALPPLTVFDIRNIVPVPKTDKQKAAVQQLMKYVGFACKLKYSPTSTVVSNGIATPYLKSALRLGDNISLIDAAKIGEEKFEKNIYNEVAQGRPCILRGANASDGGGHFFVVDGYRKSDSKYHVNWGWNKRFNGYYALSALTPSQGYDYHYYKYATIGIQPSYFLGDVNNDQRVDITDVMVLLDRIQQGDKSVIGDINSDGKINADDWQLIIDVILGRKML